MSNSQDKPKDVSGRPPKYKEEHNQQAHDLALLGLVNEEIASFFGISQSTFHRWKHDHDGFWDAIKSGREIADAKVVKSLYKRANGFTVTEIKEEEDDTGAVVKRTEFTKQIPPDTHAAHLWLRNRQPEKWRDKQEIINKNINYDLTTKDSKEASLAYQEIMGS